MQSGIEITVTGRTARLVYNAMAMFLLQDAGIDVQELTRPGLESIAQVCDAAAIMSEQGAAVRAYMQMPPSDVLDAEGLRLGLGHIEYMRLQGAVMQAINAGLQSELDDGQKKPRDLILERLSQKKN